MSITKILILQFIAHLLSDFVFQRENWITDKSRKGFKSMYLVLHCFVVFAISWVLSLQMQFFLISLLIAVSHWIIDIFKIEILKSEKFKKYAFFVDQTLHIFAIIILVLIFKGIPICLPYFNLPIISYLLSHLTIHRLLIVVGYVLCLKPANIIIKEVMEYYEIKHPEEKGLINAGKLIGITERVTSLTLILFDQFAAVGFIIAGKSIIRYKENDTIKTEYVLTGTLLSFGITFLAGIGIQYLTKHLF